MTYNLTQEEIDKLKDLISMIDYATDDGGHRLRLNRREEADLLDIVQDIRHFIA